MSTTVEHPARLDPRHLVGTFRRFGELGPAYEVIALVDEQTVTIRVVESGEELDYTLAELADDPAA